MMSKKRKVFSVMAVLLLSTPVFGAMSLEQAAQQVQARVGGRILGAATKNVRGRNVHVIKVLTPDGKRVKHFQVDAESGRIRGGRSR